MSQNTPRYAMTRTVTLSYEEADRRVREALKREGFGVLTEIDVSATLKEKLGVEFPAYEILGACNPPLAHQALQSEPDIGLLLPCNVVVRDAGEPGKVIVEIMDPVVQFDVSGTAGLEPLAQEVKARLERVLEAVAAG